MIYFITAREIGRVKIGYSANPHKRFIKMQSDSPVALCLERVCPGETTDEALLHGQFSDHRLSGEWFTLCGEIEAHMAALDAFEKPHRKIRARNELGAVRSALGLSQAEFADKLELHQSTISRFESGELPLDKRTLLAARSLLTDRAA